MKQLTAWVGGFAILLASLAPSVSHALAAANGVAPFWTEICSTDGLKVVDTAQAKTEGAGNASPDDKGGHGLHFEHCPFCQSHAGFAGLSPSSQFILPAVQSSSARPSLFYQSPHPLFIWVAAQSRAPPAA